MSDVTYEVGVGKVVENGSKAEGTVENEVKYGGNAPTADSYY